MYSLTTIVLLAACVCAAPRSRGDHHDMLGSERASLWKPASRGLGGFEAGLGDTERDLKYLNLGEEEFHTEPEFPPPAPPQPPPPPPAARPSKRPSSSSQPRRKAASQYGQYPAGGYGAAAKSTYRSPAAAGSSDRYYSVKEHGTPAKDHYAETGDIYKKSKDPSRSSPNDFLTDVLDNHEHDYLSEFPEHEPYRHSQPAPTRHSKPEKSSFSKASHADPTFERHHSVYYDSNPKEVDDLDRGHRAGAEDMECCDC